VSPPPPMMPCMWMSSYPCHTRVPPKPKLLIANVLPVFLPKLTGAHRQSPQNLPSIPLNPSSKLITLPRVNASPSTTMSPVHGCRVDGYGQACHRDGYTGGAVFVDHASSRIFH
jgi:hypothetical protein